MASTKPRTELIVGVFVLLGLVVVGGFFVVLGTLRRSPVGSYPLSVLVNDGSGVRKGIPVRLGGIDIGVVSEDPQLTDDFSRVVVRTAIYPEQRVPEGSSVSIGISGLMGDSFIKIVPPIAPSEAFYEAGDLIAAAGPSSIDDVTTVALQTLTDASRTLAELGILMRRVDQSLSRLDAEVMTDANLAHLASALENLSQSSEKLNGAGEQLEPLLTQTSEVLGKVGVAAEDVSGLLEDAEGLSASVEPTLHELMATMRQLNRLLSQAANGEGLLGSMIDDPEFRDDFVSLIDKLEKSGFLLYPRDRPNFKVFSNPEKNSE